MKNKEHINKLVEEALNSVDSIKRAEAKPYLLTRIHARMNKETGSAWEKAGWFISRPAVAFAGLCLILLVNAMVIVVNNPAGSTMAAEQTTQVPTDEFSYTVATIYDFENAQP
ncbi:MAG: hypothetical protein WBP16_10370 [Ferruginibacter sp.]